MIKNKNILLVFGVLIATLIIVFVFPLVSFSQEDRGSRIALTPLTFELTAEKGESVTERIRILNPSYEDSVTVIMEVEDMFPEGEEGRVILQATDEDLNVLAISRWVTFEPDDFVLEPREEKSVRFTIKVPSNTDSGGHYMGIIAGTPPREVKGTGVGIIHRIASLVLLTVPGEMEENVSVAGFNTSKKYYEGGPVTFESRFENKGSVHLIPDARIIVTNVFGKEVDVIQVEKRNVLPGAVRKINTEWNSGTLWGGIYNATLEGTYGRFSYFRFDSEKVTFFVFPWKAGIAIFLIMIFFIITRKRWIAVMKILIKGEAGLSKKE